MNVAIAEAGSFKDPSGRVYEIDGEILRFVAPCAADDYDFVAASGVLETLAHRGWLLGTTEVDKTRLGAAGALAHRVVRHPRLAFVSYPYEWSFPLLLQLRRWIAALDPRDTGRTAFGDYEEGHSYGSDEESAKQRFVAEFCEAVKPALLWDQCARFHGARRAPYVSSPPRTHTTGVLARDRIE